MHIDAITARRHTLIAWTQAINTHDVSALLACYTEDAVYEDLAIGQTLRGHQSIAHDSEQWFVAVPDMHIAALTILATAEHGALEWQTAGSASREIMGQKIPPTAGPFTIHGLSLVTFASDGLISRQVDSWNLPSLLRQLGIAPGDPASQRDNRSHLTTGGSQETVSPSALP